MSRIVATLGLQDTLWSRSRSACGSWMGFFKSIPKDIEGSGDGRRVRPRARDRANHHAHLAGRHPVGVIFAFTLTIQEFTYALTLITSSGQQTVGVGVPTNLVRGDIYFWGSLMAACLITSIPGGDPLQPLPRPLHLGLHRGRDQVVALRPRKNGLPGHLQHDIRLRLDELLFQLVTAARVRHHVVPCRAKDGFHHLDLGVGVVARLERTRSRACRSDNWSVQ